jgi:uncharacterized protein (TIGR02284 family)
MSTQAKTSAVLTDLIVINNDRTEGYKTASKETKESDLKDLFNSFATQSQGFAGELRQFVPAGKEQPERDETKNTGKLFRAWMDLKSAVISNDRKAILSSCEFGEDAAKRHYEDALDSKEEIPTEALEIVRKQSEELKKAHDRIKALRDSIR